MLNAEVFSLKAKSFVLAGYYGFGNAGDELILHALILELRREDPNVLITVFSNNPSETLQTHAVSAIDRWSPSAWLSPLIHATDFALGGGGLLQETTGPWNYAYYLSLVVLAKLLGCRTHGIALGVDPITQPLNRLLTRFIFNFFTDTLSVRDPSSREALLDVGVTSNIQLRLDPVFNLTMKEHDCSSESIAFVLSRSLARPLWDREVAHLLDRVSKNLGASIDLIVLFPEEDEAIARQVASECTAVRHVHIAKNALDLLSWIPHYQLVVSMRFHALVLASNVPLPFLGWGAHQKVASLCQTRGQGYTNTEEKWNEDLEFGRMASLYKSKNKTVILASRTD